MNNIFAESQAGLGARDTGKADGFIAVRLGLHSLHEYLQLIN